MNWSILLFGLVPGWAHILLGFLVRGCVVFLVFIALSVLALIHPVWKGYDLAYFSYPLLAWIWLGSFYEVYRIYRGFTSPRFLNDKKNLFLKGIKALLLRQGEQAEQYFRDVLKKNPYDSDSYYWLHRVYRFMDQPKKERRMLKRCIYYDVEEKWKNIAEL